MNKNGFHHRGQALIELATFGTILLFCLGMLVQYSMQANNEQITGMKAFRLAMLQAWRNTGPSAGASLELLEDKRMPTPDNGYALAERSDFQSAASVTWDNDLNAPYASSNLPITPNLAYLPQTYFQINHDSFAPTTVGYAIVPCNSGASFTIKEESESAIPAGSSVQYWRERTINCNDTWIEEPDLTPPPPAGSEVIKIGYYPDIVTTDRNFGHPIQSADVDNDDEDESVVKVYGTKGQKVDTFLVLDSRTGTIDEVKRNEKVQGIFSGYTKTVRQSATLKKQEGATQIYTEAHPHEEETITRTLGLQQTDGTPVNQIITSDLTYDQTFNETIHK